MQRLFLHFREGGELLRDQEGCLFADLEDAKAEALVTGREVAADWIRQGKRVSALQIEIQDQEGRVLAVMPLLNMLD
jgi:hypothetical protein